jgi:hypothetical protein
MELRKILAFVGFSLVVALALVSAVSAEECKIVDKVVVEGKSPAYVVKIGGETFLTITEATQKKMLKSNADLMAMREESAQKSALLEHFEEITVQYETTLAHQKEYIRELEEVLEGYKKLAKGYKKLKKPFLTFEGGVGATGDSKPAVLFGLGISDLRIWGFMQEENAGGLIGLQLDIF